jgi:hypothetical protein
LIASSATLALNSAENRLRVLMVIRPPYRRIHLTGLSQEAGPPLVAPAGQHKDTQKADLLSWQDSI